MYLAFIGMILGLIKSFFKLCLLALLNGIVRSDNLKTAEMNGQPHLHLQSDIAKDDRRLKWVTKLMVI